ncbi:unnamed protein product [Lactuca saligna]|uniref:Uncharacterized protein n=1 Tax=Lactuca saligna TaxID=75948 RepID=A0AA35ZFY4_LACSI|nr:unnamed protein product [Lactuca saligna]
MYGLKSQVTIYGDIYDSYHDLAGDVPCPCLCPNNFSSVSFFLSTPSTPPPFSPTSRSAVEDYDLQNSSCVLPSAIDEAAAGFNDSVVFDAFAIFDAATIDSNFSSLYKWVFEFTRSRVVFMYTTKSFKVLEDCSTVLVLQVSGGI